MTINDTGGKLSVFELHTRLALPISGDLVISIERTVCQDELVGKIFSNKESNTSQAVRSSLGFASRRGAVHYQTFFSDVRVLWPKQQHRCIGSLTWSYPDPAIN